MIKIRVQTEVIKLSYGYRYFIPLSGSDCAVQRVCIATCCVSISRFACFYDDFDATRLQLQLHSQHQSGMMKDLLQTPLSVVTVAELLKKTPGAAIFLSEVCKLTKLLLVVPVSAASAERSFSSLRRLETYLRATLGQSRLNHQLLLHCHLERADQINLNSVAQAFVCAKEIRSNFFGNFI